MLIQQIVNGLLLGSIYALVALAFSLNMGILGVLNLAIAQLFMFGGFVGLELLELHVPFVVVLLATMAIAAALSLILEVVGYHPVDKTDPALTLLTTVGFGMIIQNIAEQRWGSQAHFFPRDTLAGRIQLGPITLSVVQIVSLIVAVLVVALLAWVMQRTALGRSLRAVAQNRDAAVVLGVRVRRAEVATFLAAGLLAGGGGLLLGLNYGVMSPDFGISIGISGIAAMVLGGVDNLWGVLIAGPILGLTAVLSNVYLGGDYRDLVVFGLLALTLLFRPQGLLGAPVLVANRV